MTLKSTNSGSLLNLQRSLAYSCSWNHLQNLYILRILLRKLRDILHTRSRLFWKVLFWLKQYTLEKNRLIFCTYAFRLSSSVVDVPFITIAIIRIKSVYTFWVFVAVVQTTFIAFIFWKKISILVLISTYKDNL